MGKARTSVVQVSFNSGLINPRLDTRSDLQRASSSCRELKNFRVATPGKITRRAGLLFIAAAKVVS